MPSFPGGDRALMDFFEKTVRCPEEIKKARLRGKVRGSFVVAKNGAVENVRMIGCDLENKRGVSKRDWDLYKRCKEEALRVFGLMPKWIPGRSFGSSYAVKFHFSLTFNNPREQLCEFWDSEEIVDEKSLAKYASAFHPRYYWKTNPKRPAVTDEMKMEYTKPEGFCQVDSAERFRGYPTLRTQLDYLWAGPLLRSDDGQMISILEFVPVFSESYRKMVSRGGWVERSTLEKILDNRHRQEIRRLLGTASCDAFTMLSHAEAREKFNADSAFTFTLHLTPECYYEKDFKHLNVLLIQRNGRGYACIYSFYTDKAKENFDEYWRRIERTLRFKADLTKIKGADFTKSRSIFGRIL